MIFSTPVGIVAYGAAIPHHHILTTDIESAHGKSGVGIGRALGVRAKGFPSVDEDAVTLATDAAYQAISRSTQSNGEIGAVFIGSESHPYAVKPSGTIVKQALGLSSEIAIADLQFACKAGTQAMQIAAQYVAAKSVKTALAIGTDTAQARPGDALEYTAGAGAGAFLLGRTSLVARLIASVSVATDTPDFWRRPQQPYPEHAGRFTGEPAYFAHVTMATCKLLEECGLRSDHIDFVAFHTPNAKFPTQVAKQLGFAEQQLRHSLIVREIGNTYAAATPLALVSILDHAQAHQKILITSYGSGAGADAFLLETLPALPRQRKTWNHLLADQIAARTPSDYQTYRQHTQHIH